ncbi:MAG: hypothetical protein M2R45_03669 [Verrucomicrobia subdivision 3 bacterium]|nr:hypothetical protein [Limisphaerales bacterium]MCS1412702.1 hypothetical protein [Limisphaerales bacterium]
MKQSVLALYLGLLGLSPLRPASMNDMNHGPFVSWTIRGEGEAVTYKGIAIQLDGTTQASVCFDTDLLRYSAAWTGGFLQWYPERDGLERNPAINGTLWFHNDPGPGWSIDDSLADPRPLPYGPLPKTQAHYSGLYRTGEEVILSYSVGDHSVLESPSFTEVDNEGYFVRQFNLAPGKAPMLLRVMRIYGRDPILGGTNTGNGFGVVRLGTESQNWRIGFKGLPANATWRIEDRHLCLSLPANRESIQFALFQGGEPRSYLRNHTSNLKKHIKTFFQVADLKSLTNKTAILWPDTPQTPIRKGDDRDALAVDTLTVPQNNPWKSWIRFGGIDFLNTDQAILGSVSGDVFLVSGLAPGSTTLTWKRFATGLYQPLGIKIVDGQIYVLGRDQITRLHDTNGDGEADFYENFNNDCQVAENFHCFTLNLETDSEGNFFYAHGAPWPPKVRTPHQGVLFKVSPDGKSFESYADGLRGPNGMGIAPNDMITYSDNEGHWLPTCSVQLIRKGGFHGMKDTAHLRDAVPKDFEQPIYWIPHDVDNSAGDHIWIHSENWGPINGKMLLTSYGKSSLSLVLIQDANGTLQGGTVKLPLRFRSGLIRGRHSKFDDHLYVCGLSFWQTTSVQPGGFYRVRYTGKPLNAPIGLAVTKNGIDITFSDPVDKELATDIESYNIEQWNYRWIQRYGSPRYSVANPEQEGQDSIAIDDIELSPDGKTVSLKIAGLVPVMQMKITYRLETAAGDRLRHEIYNTIHALP